MQGRRARSGQVPVRVQRGSGLRGPASHSVREVTTRRVGSQDEPPPPEFPGLDYYADLTNFEEFCRDCLVIITKQGKRVPFVLNSSQRIILRKIRELIASGIPPRVVILKARQVGVSTLTEALLFWDCVVRPNRSALVIAHTLKSCKTLFRMSRNFHRFLEGDLKQNTRIQNVHEIELDSGSRMQVEVQGEPRGYTAQKVHLCLAPDVPVLISDGREVRADAVRAGDLVVTHLGNSAVVTGVSKRFNADPCVAVTPWLGRPVTLTKTHPVYTQRGWVRAGDLGLADEVSMPVRKITRRLRTLWLLNHARNGLRKHRRFGSGARISLSEDFGYFVGYYLAEGCIIRNKKRLPSAVVMARDCDENRYADRAWKAVSRVCPSRAQKRHSKSRTVSDIFYGSAMAELVERNFGAVDQKRVPDWVFSAGRPFCHGLLIGYLSGDGSKVAAPQATVAATSTRESLTYQMRDIAAALGYGWAAVDFKSPGLRFGRQEKAAWIARWHGEGARRIREELWLFNSPLGKRADAKYPKHVVRGGHVWMRLRSLTTAEKSLVCDIEVDHADHSFRTGSFAVKNSEIAYFEQAKDTLTAVMQTVPLTLDSLAVLESTANGMGGIGEAFHKLWQRAVGLSLDTDVPEYEKGWTPIFIPWFQHEEYELALTGGEQLYRTPDEMKLCRDHHEITNRKLKWRRWCISTNLDGDVEKFAQEYPATDQEAFSLSGRPAFDTEAVAHYTKELSVVVLAHKLPERSEIEAEPSGSGVPKIIVQEKGRLRIFFDREPRHTYRVGADPSEGDPGSDHSPLAVLDDQTMNLAATWYGKAPPDVLACYAIDLAHYFNEAEIIGEANNHGILFHNTISQMGYPNLYYRQVSPESVAQEITDKPGYLATTRNRQHLFDTLRKYVRMKMGKIHCPHMIQQIQTLVYVDDKVQAGVGSEKDLLVAFGLCLMSHRGDMHSPLEPHPETMMRAVANTAAIIKEREGAEASDRYVMVETGMTAAQWLATQDAILEHEKHQRKNGLGGSR